MTEKSASTAKKKKSAKSLTEKVSLDNSKAVVLRNEGDGQRGLSILPVLELIPQLEPFKDRATDIEEMEKRAVIDSEDAYTRGSAFETICQTNWEQLEDLRKAVKVPVDDYAKLIQSIFLPIQRRFATAKTLMNSKRLAFHKAEEARLKAEAAAVQAKNEAELLALAEQTEKSGDAKGAAAILDAATATPVSVPAVRIGGASSFGKSGSITKRWTATPEEPFKVLAAIITGSIPISVLEWKQSELNAIAAKVKAEGVYHGLKVYQTEKLVDR